MYSRRHACNLTFKTTENLLHRKKSSKVPSKVKEYIDEISRPIVSSDNVQEIVDKFHCSLNDGLSGKKSSLRCINSYVQILPTGKEGGMYLALDLGGTNFRSLLMDISESGEIVNSDKSQVPENVRSSGGYELFDFMALLTRQFLVEKKLNLEKIVLPTVLAFSFPVHQTAVDKGTVVSFSKGYDCKEVIGKDLGQLLTQAFSKNGVNIKLLAIINDTLGTMLSSKWSEPMTAGGIVIGTGTNACYMEKVNKIKDFNGDPSLPLVAVNTEWGAFGDLGELDVIRTPFDLTLDKESTNPGKHTMEKMVSGMYMGEVCRQTLAFMAERNMFCSSKLYEAIKEPFSFPSYIISKLEEEEITGNCILCKPLKRYYRQKSTADMLKQELYGKCAKESIKIQDFHIINEVCKAVTERGARLVSIAIACLAQRIDQPKVVFGIDGTMYEKTITYQKLIPKTIHSIIPNKDVQLIMQKDGSIKGAAYLAATLHEYHK